MPNNVNTCLSQSKSCFFPGKAHNAWRHFTIPDPMLYMFALYFFLFWSETWRKVWLEENIFKYFFLIFHSREAGKLISSFYLCLQLCTSLYFQFHFLLLSFLCTLFLTLTLSGLVKNFHLGILDFCFGLCLLLLQKAWLLGLDLARWGKPWRSTHRIVAIHPSLFEVCSKSSLFWISLIDTIIFILGMSSMATIHLCFGHLLINFTSRGLLMDLSVFHTFAFTYSIGFRI